MSSYMEQSIFFVGILFTLLMGIVGVKATFPKRNIYHVVCVSFVLWSLYVFVTNELLSVFHLLNRKTIAVMWILFIVITVIVIAKSKYRPGNISDIYNHVIGYFKDDIVFSLLFSIALIILLRSTWLAFIKLPITTDSMVYHLPRIFYWIQNGSVDYFDTQTLQQLCSPVLAEYINLHVMLLTNGDLYVNMVQNIAAYGCAFLLYGCLRKMNCSKSWSIMGVILLITSNEFYAEAVSSQVDMAAAFFLMINIYLLIEVLLSKDLNINKTSVFDFFILGSGCGLLYSTKGNVALSLAFIILFVVIYKLCKGSRIRDIIGLSCISAFPAVLIVLPQLVRNQIHFGDFLAREYFDIIKIGTLRPDYAFVNSIKNFANAFVNKRNTQEITDAVIRIADIVGVNLDDPSITFLETPFNLLYLLEEDRASAFLISVLILITMVMAVYRLIKYHSVLDVLAAIIFFQFFVQLFIIRWSPWTIRLFLPALVAVVIAVIYNLYFGLNGLFHSNTVMVMMIGVLLFFCITGNSESYNYLRDSACFENLHREKSRFEMYFGTDQELYDSYSNIADIIDERGYDSLGIHVSGFVSQYPLLSRFFDKKILQVVLNNDKNEGEMLNPSFSPDAVAVLLVGLDPSGTYYCNGNAYGCVYSNGSYSLWEKQSDE